MSAPSSVEIIEVIFVSTGRGDGSPGNPRRSVFQYWSKDGRLLADSDGLFDFPDRASYYAVERLMQLGGIPSEAVSPAEGLRPSSLPAVYVDAASRNVTPHDVVRDRIGVGFDVPGGGTVRFALAPADALTLAVLLHGACKVGGHDQTRDERLQEFNTCFDANAEAMKEQLADLARLEAQRARVDAPARHDILAP